MGTKVNGKRHTALGTSEATNQAVAIYARVSTEDQAERDTVQNQLAFFRKFVEMYQLTVAGEYVDEGISGTVPLADRPEGQRLLVDAEAGRFNVVLVYRVDRLGRSLTASLDAHAVLDSYGVAIKSTTEPFDTSNDIGKFIFQLLGSLAELERSTIATRMNLGKHRVAGVGRTPAVRFSSVTTSTSIGCSCHRVGSCHNSASPKPRWCATSSSALRAARTR